jgi:hypothetical protein
MTIEMIETTATMTEPDMQPSLDAIIRQWIEDARALHDDLNALLTQRDLKTGLSPGSRKALHDLLLRLHACRAHAPSDAMVRYWLRTGGNFSPESAAVRARRRR